MPTNVEVVFDVTADASGVIDVFGLAKIAVSNVVVAAVTLPAADLYTDASAALIKFQGYSASGPVDDISGVRDSSWAKLTELTNDISGVLNGRLDASGAAPFSSYKSAYDYYNMDNFGELALAAYAEKMFGHPQATAAIDNDQLFMQRMLSKTGTAFDAGLHTLLAGAINTLDATKATSVARQVIGQDASRAMSADNDVSTPDNVQRLRFIAGDIIYMKIHLQAPTVTYKNAAQQYTAVATTAAAFDQTYTLKITLA